MDAECAKNLLDILIENSLRILRAGFGVNWAEATFFNIIDLVRSTPTLKEYFLERVRISLSFRDPGRLEPDGLPRELIELATHELRWIEFQNLANKRIQEFFGGDTSLAMGDIVQAVAEAYDENWRDREFYSRYTGKTIPQK